MVRPYWPATVPEANTKVVTAPDRGSPASPRFNVPPAPTVRLPPTSVRVDVATRLAVSVPLIVVVLALSGAEPSKVTVVPAAMVTAVQEEGITSRSQVAVSSQLPFWT